MICVMLLASCTTVKIFDEQGEIQKGIEYYKAEPYLLVTPKIDGTNKLEIISLPGEKRYAKSLTYYGTSEFKLDLTNGMFSSSTEKTDPKYAETVSAIASAAATAFGAVPDLKRVNEEIRKGVIGMGEGGSFLATLVENEIVRFKELELKYPEFKSETTAIMKILENERAAAAIIRGLNEKSRKDKILQFQALNNSLQNNLESWLIQLTDKDKYKALASEVTILIKESKNWIGYLLIVPKDYSSKLYKIVNTGTKTQFVEVKYN